MRGQSSTEFLAITAFGLLVLTPLLIYLISSTPYSEYKTTLISAESTLKELSNECELVATQPPGTSKIVTLQLPRHSQKLKFNEKGHIVLITEYAGLHNEIIKKIFAEFENKEINLNGGGYVTSLRIINDGDKLKVEEVKR